MTSPTIGCLTLLKRAIAWLIMTISSREKCRSTPAETLSPMLNIRIEACSRDVMLRFNELRAFNICMTSGWVDIGFIAAYPLLNHFRHTFGVVFCQHLQMLDLQLKP